MTEDDDLLARISQLSGNWSSSTSLAFPQLTLPGQINQRKNHGDAGHRGSHHATPYAPQHAHPRHHVGWAPYRGRGRPYRRGHGPHRHRTLVLNNGGTGSDPATATPSDLSNDEASDVKPAQQGGWITKRDRHMQLINPAIYDQETQARAKAMEETRKLRTQKKTERDQTKVMRHAHAVDTGNAGPSTSAVAPAAAYQVVVEGIPFHVTQGGSKLIRIASEIHSKAQNSWEYDLPSIGEPFAANTTPKKANVGGVTFVRSKKGNLYRLGAVVSKKCVLLYRRVIKTIARFN